MVFFALPLLEGVIFAVKIRKKYKFCFNQFKNLYGCRYVATSMSTYNWQFWRVRRDSCRGRTPQGAQPRPWGFPTLCPRQSSSRTAGCRRQGRAAPTPPLPFFQGRCGCCARPQGVLRPRRRPAWARPAAYSCPWARPPAPSLTAAADWQPPAAAETPSNSTPSGCWGSANAPMLANLPRLKIKSKLC